MIDVDLDINVLLPFSAVQCQMMILSEHASAAKKMQQERNLTIRISMPTLIASQERYFRLHHKIAG